MRKNKLFSLIIAIFFLFSLTSCSDDTSGNGGQLVKVATVVAPTHPVNIAMREVFLPMIEEETNGRYNVQLYDSGRLGGEKQLYDYTRSGIIEISAVGTVMWSEIDMMATPDFPFIFRDVEHARKVYEGEIGDEIAKYLEDREPLKFMAWAPNGARVFSSSKDLKKIEDFKGQKLRMPNNPIHVKLAESLGANVVIMDMSEVFTSLEQGVIDGQDNPLSTFRQEGWYTVSKDIYETNHMVSSIEMLGNKEFLDSLPKEDREIFEKVAKKTAQRAWDIYEKSIEDDKEFLKKEGLNITEPTEEDRQKMKEMAKPVYDYLYKKYDWAEDLIKRIEQVK
ncbi:TRAP transporter substrate-binding protein [Anaerococcus porci]|uniref:TRAP transporter substrate-binding protein n=1 Tax=Anaerococcus porci TaxID=2652269 RepID=A0A6N7VSI8_9FIRM|nr:TRAP transporter substrate-binding protein [Anaerococcus porci]MDY3006861.1 TRAP transporter substrate-binding protein [Anaerococcus porci]MSS77812.1 TRAP transporter substrate-binding protein [Anaerococcus porci]